ncbi:MULTISPECIES: F0F1 ATP synthase subunit B [Aequorivita]|jgi:F-type H+-transporting ATPase subunit b|uniref:ATP synthase subunit b n=2 Tax=Aequorivita TaxID=153265 RepID=A0A137RKA0_9FLAO|nr:MULTISPECIES: F0F1 ATP synthase subunit B [Aequorivita]MAB56767.1 ATP synthase F0 subunit B [Aequorivita sp.]KJJ38692.1 ATP F0F1 synthase subunit B [Aequorivita vladivostokensis]KXO00610.1 ATP F0F1 synthase subunit B [Aequorivita aquimaris]MAO48486.1 ATP synthase F0 subunit B [Aequorivita sp.]MBF30093.1 ATP synthase F0 subunit B [Aequorivita sp.]|tara:strand:+ start:292066 stop:292557 length:492 start_codon:yes stop_codon:yes gene_type:complete
MNIVAPESLIFWTTIIFLLLLFLLRKFAWKPILGAVRSRETSINDALEAAEKAKLEMQNMHADNEKLLQEARAEREAMMKEARELKAKMIADAKEDAKLEADKMVAQAQAAIESEKKAAIAELKQQVASLSLEIAEKVVKHELSDSDKQMKLVNEMLGEAKLN